MRTAALHALRRLLPSVGAQISAIVVLAVASAHLVTYLAIIAFGVPANLLRDPLAASGQVTMFVRLYDGQPDAPGRDRLLASAAGGEVSVERGPPPRDAAPALPGGLAYIVGIAIGDGARALEPVPDGRPSLVTVLDGHGMALSFRPSPGPRALLNPRTVSIFVSGISLVIGLAALGVYAVRWITAPLQAFAAAADAFGKSGADAALPEGGSREVALVAAALNGMRSRVLVLIDERTRMLAALSHDLRTPLTRLRFRAEQAEAPEAREAMLRDIGRIDGLLRDTMAYVEAGHSVGPMPRTDLGSLLQTVSDDFADTGHAVSFASAGRMSVDAPPSALARLFSNLVDNAVKHGGSARVALSGVGDRAVVTVSDDGPGIADADKAAAFEPFRRGDASRGAGGFGLGLSIAKGIAERLGGGIALGDGIPGGLVVTVTLPLSAAGVTSAERA